MGIGFSLKWNVRTRLLNLFQPVAIGLFSLGIFLGIAAVTTWQQWALTFGQDPVFLFAVTLVLSLSIGFGRRWQPALSATSGNRPLFSLVLCLAVWSQLHPYWIDALTSLMSHIPIVWLENTILKSVVAITFAGLGWFIPGILCTAVIASIGSRSNESSASRPWEYSAILSGVAYGLVLNSTVLAPWLGYFLPTAVAAVPASVISWWLGRVVGSKFFWAKSTKDDASRIAVTSTGEADHELNGFAASVEKTELRPSSLRNTTGPEKSSRSESGLEGIGIQNGIACLVGCLLACNLRLVNQLMPHSSFVLLIEIAGLIFGVAFGLLIAPRSRRVSERAAWGALIATASGSLLLALQPTLVDLSLRMNASLTTVSLLLAARVTLLMGSTFPFGIALAWIAGPNSSENRASRLLGFAPFAFGMGAATLVLGGNVNLFPLMGSCVGAIVLTAAFVQIRSLQRPISLPSSLGMGSLAVIALCLPIWRSNDDPSRTAKLLFSTPAFIAYRTGWDIEHLPYLDDVRMIDRMEGRTGPLTLWRGKVAELYVREAGVPRAVISKQTEIVPQFSPEVLQSVYSMVLSDRPGRVLVLGLSAGVPLSTCLNFPIREAVCVEGDSNLIDMVRGPLARETGLDPLADDRVVLHRISPEMALMAEPSEPFDVILSCPSASSLMDSAAQFTKEFYQRASRQLAERGLFCQRFECVDYGPEPLQIVLKSMRSSFHQVIAIEAMAGEMLIFATNSDDRFVPSDLAVRLELPHVRRVLARSGLDWSALLNFPTFDHAALCEVCEDSRQAANSTFNGTLAARSPLEVMRWGNKLQEVQDVLTSMRVSQAPFWTENKKHQPNWIDKEIHLSRRSRLVEWTEDGQVSNELVRRLDEIVTTQKTVRENPDEHWWKYRKVLRKQLQDRPRTAIQQVKAVDEKRSLHSEDARRRDYFIALGNAATREKPTRDQIADVEEYLEPYDPLLSYFAKQESAEMLARSGLDAARELAYRLHVIYFAPTVDASVRNVAKALDSLVRHPDAISDDSIRYDALNGLIQTLRVRWEVRQSIRENSSKKILDDVDQSLLAVEKGVTTLEGIYASAGVSDQEWHARKQVIERLMLRPLRAYRAEVQLRQLRGQAQAKSIVDEANSQDEQDEEK